MYTPNYKDVSKSHILAIDIETYDPKLAKEEGGLGPGVYRNDGYILGVSVADDEGFSEYYNLGHFLCGEGERERNIEYLRSILALPMPKLGANLAYDVDWLENWKGDESKGYRWKAPCFKVNGLLYDVQVAEYLIDENQGQYSLDFLATKYLSKGKYKDDIEAYREAHNKEADKQHIWKGDVRKWLYKMPYEVVHKYAVEDVLEPFAIFKKQKQIIVDNGLWDTFIMETELLRATLSMRREGTPVDTRKRDMNAYKAGCEKEKRMLALEKQYGSINLNSTQQLAVLFDGLQVEYPFKLRYKTRKGVEKEEQVSLQDAKEILRFMQNGKEPPESLLNITYNDYSEIISCNPSITKEWFESMEKQLDDDTDMHGLLKDILFIRKADKIVNDFLMGSMRENLCPDGKIHPSIHNTRNDEYGTRSGRFSMSNPNLQQIPSPSRDKFWGTMCRESFVPLPNCWWVKIDYSQIEYRCLAHYASGLGSAELVEAYKRDPHTDYHQYIMDMTGLARSYAKNLNFGCMYGMGKKKMARYFGWGDKYADEVLNVYHGNAPYVKHTMNTVSQVAKARGYIKTLSGRRANLVDKDKAYIMVNRLIQGSAADIMKKAMVDVYKSGVLKTITWHLTVHDELDMSVPKTAQGIREVFRVKNIMESAFTLKVPIKAELELGKDWAHVDEIDFTDLDVTEETWLARLTDENVEREVQAVIKRCSEIKTEKKSKTTK